MYKSDNLAFGFPAPFDAFYNVHFTLAYSN